MQMNYNFYKISTEESYWRVRDFLRQAWRGTDDKTLNWTAARLDYNRWHMFKNCYELDLLDYIYCCEYEDEIIAVFIADCMHGYHLQVHPNHYSAEVFDMLFTNFETVIENSKSLKEIHIASPVDDGIFENALSKAGFEPTNWIEVRREAILTEIITAPVLPSGFQVRALGPVKELPDRSWASWRAFHPDEPDENYEGWEWYKNLQLCPLYRRDLDLVCIAADGSITGFATMWYDDYNQLGYIDPVGVTPDHWRKGIGKALVTECLIRVQKLGARRAYIESFDAPAHALYESAGLKAVKSLRTWRNKITKQPDT
ncbi:GNAT family N-acetyltransferase [Candidatus Cloacimonadota bacterium]